jgi:hypothetical protein
MIPPERTYRLLLRAYPSRFRAAFGREMTTVFRDRRREMRASPVRFWAEILTDIARSAPVLRLDAARARWSPEPLSEEVVMMTMSILAVLVGAFEVMNTLIEVAAGGISNRSALALAAIVLAILAGVTMLVAGISMLRGAPRAPFLARAAAVTCLAVFALIGALVPLLSIFSILIGVGFPIALLIYFGTHRALGERPPRTA